MNILIFSWRGPGHPNEGGAEQVTHEHAKVWVKAGHKVTLFTSIFPKAKKEEKVDGIRIIREGTQIIWVQVAALVWYLFKKKESYDLVIDQFHGIPFFTPLFVRTKKLAFIHEVAKEVWTLNPLPFPLSLAPKYLGPLFEPLMFQRIYQNIKFLTVSESTKKDLVEWGINSEDIKVILNGVKLDLPKKVLTREDKTLIYLGALSKDKGIDDAIKAFSEIVKRDKSWKFWIVGGGTDEIVKEAKQLIYDLDIVDKVKFWGFVTERKKFELLSKSAIMINPSIREGWGLVNIEANSVGTPVVGYKVQGIRDSVLHNKTGLLVNKGDYKKMAMDILDLVKDPKRYGAFQENSKKWASEFSWSKSTELSLKLINNL